MNETSNCWNSPWPFQLRMCGLYIAFAGFFALPYDCRLWEVSKSALAYHGPHIGRHPISITGLDAYNTSAVIK